MGKYPSSAARAGRHGLKQNVIAPRSVFIAILISLTFFFFAPAYTLYAQGTEKGSVLFQPSLEIPSETEDKTPKTAADLEKFDLLSSKETTVIGELINDTRFDDFIADKGIERSDRISSYLLFKAEAALKAGRGREALNLGEMALQISPLSPIPSFFLAKAIWRTNPMDVFHVFSHYFNGIRLILGDFLFIVPVLSSFLIYVLIALFLSVLAFIVYSLFAFLPLWIHRISETSKGYLHPLPAGLLFTFLLLTPLLLGLPLMWSLLFAFALFWGFYGRAEKGIVFAFIVLLGATPWVLPAALSIFAANGSLIFDEMSRNYHADYLWAPPPVELNQAGWESRFIQAAYATQRGDYAGAEAFYQGALKENPNVPIILNNLGNLAFYRKEYEEAIDYYQQAIDVAPELVSAHYNMSQAYREMLLFKEGEAVFEKASEISAESTKRYAMKSTRYPGFPVIEERFTRANLIHRLFAQTDQSRNFSEKIWQGLIGQIALEKAPLVAGFWVTLLWICGTLHRSFISEKQCAFCKKPICHHCGRRLFSYQVCKPCEMRFVSVRRKSDFEMIENAVKRIPSRVYPFFVIPGGGHLAIKRTKTGFSLLFAFFMLLSTIFFRDILSPQTEWYLHQPRSVLPILLILILYIVALSDLLIKRSRQKWL